MESRPPGLVVEHSRSWAYFPADWEQQGSWREATRHLGQPFTSRARAKGFTTWWVPVMENAVDTGCVGVFLHAGFRGLLEQPDLVVRLTRHEHGPALTAAQAIDEVLRNARRSDDPRPAPPVIEPVPGCDVGAVRVRVRQQVGGRRRKLREDVLWLVPLAGAVWTLSTSFYDHAEFAEGRVADVDALVNGMRDPMRNADVPFVVVRPEIPEPRPTFGFGHLVARSFLAIDRERGEVTWADDNYRQRRMTLPLGSGPGEVAGLLRATYRFAYYVRPKESCRLMLVDGEGRVLARSAAWQLHDFDRAWPVELLEASGLPVHDRQFRNTAVMDKEYPDSAPMYWLTGNVWMLPLLSLVGFVLMIAVGGLVVGDPIWSDW